MEPRSSAHEARAILPRDSPVFKRGDKWSVKQPLPDGRYRWRTVGTRKKDAEALRDELNRRTLLGAAYVEPPKTLRAVRDEWLAAYEQPSRPASVAIARTSLAHLAVYEDRLVETFRASELEALVVGLARRAPRIAQLTLRHAKMVLHTARERGQVVDPALFTLKAPGHDEREPVFLTWEQVETLASWMPDDLARIVPFAASSGLREGECLGLRDGDVDFGHSTVRVRQAKTRCGVRVVDLPPVALRLLREQLLARPPGTDLVFPSPTGKLLDRNRLMGRYFRPAAVRAGLGERAADGHYRGVVFHDLRHTFVSLMALAGVHVSVIAAMVGHKDGGALLLRRYRHLFPHEQKAAAAAFERLVVRGGVAQGLQAASGHEREQ
jgi:integrase